MELFPLGGYMWTNIFKMCLFHSTCLALSQCPPLGYFWGALWFPNERLMRILVYQSCFSTTRFLAFVIPHERCSNKSIWPRLVIFGNWLRSHPGKPGERMQKLWRDVWWGGVGGLMVLLISGEEWQVTAWTTRPSVVYDAQVRRKAVNSLMVEMIPSFPRVMNSVVTIHRLEPQCRRGERTDGTGEW